MLLQKLAKERHLSAEQVGEISAKLLSGDHEPSVFDERARVHQILDVFPGGATLAGVPMFDHVGPRRILGERATPQ